MWRGAAAVLLLAASAGCTRLAPDCARSGLSSFTVLECRASTGDKLAAFELGQRYELGDGVKRDPRRAAKLYKQAATFTSGTTYVYSPPVGKGGRGTVIPVRTGPDRPGLAEAKYRLGVMYLEGRGVRFDFPRGRKLIEEAAAQGSAAAIAKLKALAAAPRT